MDDCFMVVVVLGSIMFMGCITSVSHKMIEHDLEASNVTHHHEVIRHGSLPGDPSEAALVVRHTSLTHYLHIVLSIEKQQCCKRYRRT
jgi:hypothetical protein